MKGARHVSCGLTLIELLLALTVSSITILGAVRLYAHAASVFRAAHAEQSLEEAAQLAITVLRHDIELAGFLPFMPYGEPIPESALQFATIAVRNDCGDQWAIALTEAVGGSNDGYRLDCRAYAQSPAPSADTLVVRYVEPEPVTALEPGRIYLQSSAGGLAQVFVAPDGPGLSSDPLVTTHALRTRAYYVSTASISDAPGADIPSLRVKHLTQRNGRAVVVDEEVQPGIEDFQVEYGTGVDQFATAAELSADDHVRLVRIWLLIRSAYAQNNAGGYIPAYAGRSARTITDGYRRRLVTTTIAITDDRPL
jgi:Tfp pilus assembly protein PilW